MSEGEALAVPPVEVSGDKADHDATPDTDVKPITTDTMTPARASTEDVTLATEDSTPATEEKKPDIKDTPADDKADTASSEDPPKDTETNKADTAISKDPPKDTKPETHKAATAISEEPPKDTEPETSAVKEEEEAMETSEPAEPLSEPTPLEAKIIRQIEYYFGNHNLARDRFLKEEVKKDDGWVSMDIMVKFQRLSQMSTDYKVICDALRKSKAGLMEVSKDNAKIRRIPEKVIPDFSEERKEEMNYRSIYAKGFPPETSLDDLLEFFSKFGPTETLFMRRYPPNRTFKGSVFVMFDRKEDAENFVKAESIKYKEKELERLMKADYFLKKGDSFKNRRDEKSKKDDVDHQKRIEKEKAKLCTEIKKGAVIYMKGFTGTTTYREHIHNVFSDYATIVWIDFFKGQTEGWIRFEAENAAKPALEKAVEATDGKLMINDQEIQTSILEGAEEDEYWQRVFTQQAERRATNQNRFRKGDKRGPWQRKGRKRRGDDARDDDGGGDDNVAKDNGQAEEGAEGAEGEPPAKAIKTETNEAIKKETEDKTDEKTETETKEPEPVKMETATELQTEMKTEAMPEAIATE